MGALANRDFVKMNGLGNEIVIVDLRGAPGLIAEAEARAAAEREPYDQLMALYPARAGQNSSIDAFIRIYNNDGSEAGACGNGMRCVAALVSEETGRTKLNFETSAGLIPCWRGDGGLYTVDMGKPRLALGPDSARRGIRRHKADRARNRAARLPDHAFALGREHGQSACDFLGRRSRGL